MTSAISPLTSPHAALPSPGPEANLLQKHISYCPTSVTTLVQYYLTGQKPKDNKLYNKGQPSIAKGPLGRTDQTFHAFNC